MTFTNPTLGVVSLTETGPGTGVYSAAAGSFPGGTFELDVFAGADTVQNVVTEGPGVFGVTTPQVNDTVPAGQDLLIAWTLPSTAKAAELETRDFSLVTLPDTGAYLLAGIDNPAHTSQRLRVYRFNDIDITGALAGSRLKIKIRISVDPYVVQ